MAPASCRTWLPWLLAVLGLLPSSGASAAPLRVMILDGESAGTYHRWDQTTPVLRRALEETGLFKVDVLTAPPAGADFSAFHPRFDQYRAVVVNYDAPDGRWPGELKSSFERYVKQGGGVVMVHAADNAFPGWNAWNRMNGVGGWRGRTEQAGPWWHYERGKMVADASPGAAGSHGRRDPFLITVRAEHPITRGLPASFIHGGDELYARLRGPGRDMTVLATAWSDPANAGSGRHEPVLMVLRYGRGRIFHTTLGHDVDAMVSVDFLVALQRGVEWVATGAVRQPVPADFPTDAVRVRPGLLSTD
jgi:uncharacterized protein